MNLSGGKTSGAAAKSVSRSKSCMISKREIRMVVPCRRMVDSHTLSYMNVNEYTIITSGNQMPSHTDLMNTVHYQTVGVYVHHRVVLHKLPDAQLCKSCSQHKDNEDQQQEAAVALT